MSNWYQIGAFGDFFHALVLDFSFYDVIDSILVSYIY